MVLRVKLTEEENAVVARSKIHRYGEEAAKHYHSGYELATIISEFVNLNEDSQYSYIKNAAYYKGNVLKDFGYRISDKANDQLEKLADDTNKQFEKRASLYDKMLSSEEKKDRKITKTTIVRAALAYRNAKLPAEKDEAKDEPLSLKIFSWSLNGKMDAIGYTVPTRLIVENILSAEADVVFLNEYELFAPGAAELEKWLDEQDYRIATSWSVKREGVLCAVKKELFELFAECTLKEFEDTATPDFAGLICSYRGKRCLFASFKASFSRDKQLLERLNKSCTENRLSIVTAGNCDDTDNSLQRKAEPFRNIKAVSPKRGCRFSYTFKHGERVSFDHMIVSSDVIAAECTYDYSFLKNYPELYCRRSEDMPLSDLPLPDHAILKATIVI